MNFYKKYFALILLSISIACDNNEAVQPSVESKLNGDGQFTFSYEPLKEKPISVFYNVPENINLNSKVLIVFHGNGRDAKESRDLLIDESIEKGFVLIVPEFSNEDFPGGDSYNLGNIFEDGDNPSPASLNPEDEWTFSLIEPLFDRVKELTGIQTDQYDVYGHSAGAQVAHRYIFFWNESRINRVVASAAGWYTLPDASVEFPYGLDSSPAENDSLVNFFTIPLTIIVGALDNDPNAPALRRNEQADIQGTNRLDRAQYFYQESLDIARSQNLSFNWIYRTLNNVSHDYEACANYAVNYLY